MQGKKHCNYRHFLLNYEKCQLSNKYTDLLSIVDIVVFKRSKEKFRTTC